MNAPATTRRGRLGRALLIAGTIVLAIIAAPILLTKLFADAKAERR